MSVNTFNGARKALVAAVAMAAVLGSVTVSSYTQAATSTTSVVAQNTVSTVLTNRTNGEWTKGILKKSGGFAVPATAANRKAFKVGASVRFADGQVRKITKGYVVGSDISIFTEGAALDAAKVGYPNVIVFGASAESIAVAPSGSTPSTGATTGSSSNSSASAVASIIASTILTDRTNGEWTKGILKKSGGFAVPATAANRAAFKVGASVRFADGQVRKITKGYVVGANITIFTEGAALDASKTGYPNVVSAVNPNASAGGTESNVVTPTPAPAPALAVPAPAPVAEKVIATSALNSFTSSDWLNGVWRKSAGFSLKATSANKAAFIKGATVKLADGQTRTVTAIYASADNMSVMLDGAAIDGNSVGYPKTVSVVSGTASGSTGGNASTGGGSTGSTGGSSGSTGSTGSTGSNGSPGGNTTGTETGSTTPSTGGAPISLVGVNLAGAEFGHHLAGLPGTHGKEYIYPGEESFKRYADLKMNLVRLPFRWERLQPKLNTELNANELKLMLKTLDYAQKHNVKVLLDMHNYYRYYEKLIATKDVPIASFADTWRRIAEKVGNHPAVYAYGLMNEPYNTNGYWPEAALAAAKAIRTVDKNRWIFVAGDRYSSAYHWEAFNPRLISDAWMRDPKNNLVYEAHMYIDHDFSGRFADTKAVYDPQIGVNRVKPFVEWLKKHNLRGHLGEHGIPDFSPSAVVATDNLLTYLRQNCMTSTYWAGGPWWGEYALSLDVKSGKHRPQLPMLQKQAAAGHSCTTIGPAK